MNSERDEDSSSGWSGEDSSESGSDSYYLELEEDSDEVPEGVEIDSDSSSVGDIAVAAAADEKVCCW